jgi:hypothetical protein
MYCGTAIAAKIAMIATTTKSSINVKPLEFFITKPPLVL